MCLEFTEVDRYILRCRPCGPITAEDRQNLITFVRQYAVNLLLDFSAQTAEVAARELRILRPLLPITALVGPEMSDFAMRDLPGKHHIMHAVRAFSREDEALNWLRQHSAGLAHHQRIGSIAPQDSPDVAQV